MTSGVVTWRRSLCSLMGVVADAATMDDDDVCRDAMSGGGGIVREAFKFGGNIFSFTFRSGKILLRLKLLIELLGFVEAMAENKVYEEKNN